MKRNKILLSVLGVSSLFGSMALAQNASSNQTENIRLYTNTASSKAFKPFSGTVINVKVGSVLNVRQSPSTSAPVVGTLKNGANVEINYEAIGDWYQINYNGQKGYVHSNYINQGFNNNSSTNNGGQGQVGPRALVTVSNNSSLNVRTSPSTSGEVIDSLKNGDIVEVSKKHGDWYEVSFKGNSNTGFVYGKYLDFGKVDNNNSSNSNNNNNNNDESQWKPFYGTVNINPKSTLNVRQSPNSKSPVIGGLKNGEKIEIHYAAIGNWYEITYKGGKGYVFADYIENAYNTNSSSNGGGQGQVGSRALVTVSNNSALNVRTSPSTSGKIIGSFKNGEIVEVTEKHGDWYKVVRLKNKLEGYVHGGYLNFGTK